MGQTKPILTLESAMCEIKKMYANYFKYDDTAALVESYFKKLSSDFTSLNVKMLSFSEQDSDIIRIALPASYASKKLYDRVLNELCNKYGVTSNYIIDKVSAFYETINKDLMCIVGSLDLLSCNARWALKTIHPNIRSIRDLIRLNKADLNKSDGKSPEQVSIDEFGLSKEAFDCLRSNLVYNMADLIAFGKGRLLTIKELDSTDYEEIVDLVHQMGYGFSDEIGNNYVSKLSDNNYNEIVNLVHQMGYAFADENPLDIDRKCSLDRDFEQKYAKTKESVIDVLDGKLSYETMTSLKRTGVVTVYELITMSKDEIIGRVGINGYQEIWNVLHKYGYKFKCELNEVNSLQDKIKRLKDIEAQIKILSMEYEQLSLEIDENKRKALK